jgi:hypothetical protein
MLLASIGASGTGAQSVTEPQSPNYFTPAFTDGFAANSKRASSDPCTVVTVEPAKGPPKIVSPDGWQYVVNDVDKNHNYQIFVSGRGTDDLHCITCNRRPGAPLPQRDKTMATWHPSGRWIAVAGEKDKHALQWIPKPLRQEWVQCGVWMDMYATTPDGTCWYKLLECDGYTGPAFTPDGKKAVWAQIVGPVSKRDHVGKWALKIADFVDSGGYPRLENIRDITPPNTDWVEPGNFHPNGKDLLISADTDLPQAEWQDQFILDIYTGRLKNLTNSPRVWDEHGLFSPDGKKIVWMSSYPYRNQPNSWKILGLKTEFMMMNSDGTDVRQLTHLQVPGYRESPHKDSGCAAVACFNQDGTEILGSQMLLGKKFPDGAYWKIKFSGPCGSASR